MKSLELLGLQSDGEHITLNDAEGNRYSLPVTDDLRALLRRDRDPKEIATKPAHQMAPREIQALIRQGKTVDEVSELAATPASRIAALAHPIEVERAYTAQQARRFPVSQDTGAFTLEELVTSRLVGRGVPARSVVWDATRTHGHPWELTAGFEVDGNPHRARWSVDMEARTVEALNDEAAWLSESSLEHDAAPWRPVNTPPAENLGGVPSIDAVLSSLDSQRGKFRPMPDEDNDVPAPGFDGAHPAADTPADGPTARVLPLRAPDTPGQRSLLKELGVLERADQRTAMEAHPTDGTNAADAAAPTTADQPASSTEPGSAPKAAEPAPEPKKKASRRRKDRPTMPSWDEIVFGKKD